MKETIDKLKNDNDYYGEFGKQFLSNSDIGDLLNNPKNFKSNSETTSAMLIGSYFHTAMLEPEKLKDFQIVDASTRNTNIYKDAKAQSGKELLLLRGEADETDKLIATMRSNFTMYEGIYKEGNKFEVPIVKEIFGVMWKGKADIVSDDCLIDIKTTSSIADFRRSAYKYNYDSQAWLYSEFFGKPMKFYVIDKTSGMLGIFEPSEEFLLNGRAKVIAAIEVYQKFFGPDAYEDINNYILEEEL